MSATEAVPQSIAALLPQINVVGTGGLSKLQTKGVGVITPDVYSSVTKRQRTLGFTLNLQQSIFDFTNWQNLGSARNSAKAADATFNAAAQDLMQRTSKAYFNVLNAEDTLRYTEAEKKALYQEYVRAQHSFKVGVKTITDVYNAKAAYDKSVAQHVSAENDLENRKEDLRSITGILYDSLAPLKDKIPLETPDSKDINQWVEIAVRQNWGLLAAHYTTLAAKNDIRAAFGGHLPTLDLAANYGNNYTNVLDSTSRNRTKGPAAELDLTVPIFSGGNITSQTRQKIADYEFASNKEVETYRGVINNSRKSYLGIVSGISSVKANKQVVVSNRSSLMGTQEGYKVGTRTMVDVLQAQQDLYSSQKNYASSRYDYVLSIIGLKQAAGTLNANDLQIINSWLENNNDKSKSK